MNREAVLLAREIIAAVPEEHVDMSDWECGTHACLLGHMALSGKFPGLVMNGEPDKRRPIYLPTGLESFSAGAAVLGIGRSKAIELFREPYNRELFYFRQDGLGHKAIALDRLDALLAEDAAVELAP